MKAPNIGEALSVVVKGEQIRLLVGVEAKRISAFACKDGTPKAVIFQFDERDQTGRFIGNAGSIGQRDEYPGIIDENDEIAFMFSDLGDECPPSVLARSSGDVHEVEATSSSLKETGYFYILVGDRGLVLSKQLIHYESDTNIMRSDYHTIGFSPKSPVIVEKMAFSEYRPRPNEDLIDRIKLRFTGRALNDLISISLDESDMDAELIAVRTGALRAIREIEMAITPVPGFSLTGRITFILYRRHAEIYMTMDVP